MRRLGCLLILLPPLSAGLYSVATGQSEFAVSEQAVFGSLFAMVVGLVMLVKGQGPLVSPAVAGAGCAGLALLGPGALLVMMSQYEVASAREIALHGHESGLYRVTEFQPTALRVRVARHSRNSSEESDLVGLVAPDGTPLLVQVGAGESLGAEVVGRVMPYSQAESLRALARRQNPREKVPTAHVLEPGSLGWARVGSVLGWALMAGGVVLFGAGLWASRDLKNFPREVS